MENRKTPSCVDCKNFIENEKLQDRGWFGRRKSNSTSITHGICKLNMMHASVNRSEAWSENVNPCDVHGRGFEPLERKSKWMANIYWK